MYTEKHTMAIRRDKGYIMYTIQYIIAIVIVMLFLVGFALLSVRLHMRAGIYQQPAKKVQSQETDDASETDELPKRSFFGALLGERTIV
jgi:hypothetical protein